MSMKDRKEIIKKHQNMLCGEMMVNSCVMVHLLNHLKSNLEEAEGNPSYRKRERMRSKIALRQINKWFTEYENEIKIKS